MSIVKVGLTKISHIGMEEYLILEKVLVSEDPTGGNPNKKIEILKKTFRFDIIRNNSVQREPDEA